MFFYERLLIVFEMSSTKMPVNVKFPKKEILDFIESRFYYNIIKKSAPQSPELTYATTVGSPTYSGMQIAARKRP
jgi:hypothetical protein